MYLNCIFEMSLTLNCKEFQTLFSKAYGKADCIRTDKEYIDNSLSSKGITVMYRNSRYKKKIQITVNSYLVTDNPEKLICKLDNYISEYFNNKYKLKDFILSGINLVTDIDVKSSESVSAYLKVLHRIGKVKGFTPITHDCFPENAGFYLEGNSNGIDFIVYDLEKVVSSAGYSISTDRNKARTKGILRIEVCLTKPKAIRNCTGEFEICRQLSKVTANSRDIFLETFTQIIPFGGFYKKDRATEIIQKSVKDQTVKRKMLRLLALIPEKKSLYLAQKAMNCRNVEKVMEAFAEINLSPVTISKRHEVKHLDNLYSYFL